MALKAGQQEEDVVFKEERAGWHGYVEWEKYPERKAEAARILSKYNFPDPPEFQLAPLPKTNPVLQGERHTAYHEVMGPTLSGLPEQSWAIVKREKAADMVHVLKFPYNGEPPRRRLVETAITRNEDYFVRNHGGIPDIEADQHFLEIDGLVKNPRSFSLSDLQDEKLFPRTSMVVTLQCSGTRRLEQIDLYPGDGDELINAPWGEGAIGTARWTGVSLKKVIKACGGMKDDGQHLEFYGADSYFKKGNVFNYVVSVPWRKVKLGEVILAWEMNGKPLPKIHGYPLRVVVAGYIGARSVKWLYRVKAISGPSSAPVQKKEYLYYTGQVGKHSVMYSNGFSIQDMPVSSALMTPVEKEVVIHKGNIRCSGWAYSGGTGGNWPIRVEVSPDGGSVWYAVPEENMSQKYFHAWRTWTIDLPCDAEGWLEIAVRCWDNSLNTQPTFVRSAWNWDLHVTSSAHRVKVYSVNTSRELTRMRLQQLEERGEKFEPITKPLEFDLESDEHYEKEMEKHGGRDPVE